MSSRGKKRPPPYYQPRHTRAWWFVVYDPPTILRKKWYGEPLNFDTLLFVTEDKIRDIFPFTKLKWQYLETLHVSEEANNLVRLPAIDWPKWPAVDYKVYGFPIQNDMKPAELQALSSLFAKYGFESRMMERSTYTQHDTFGPYDYFCNGQHLYYFDYS